MPTIRFKPRPGAVWYGLPLGSDPPDEVAGGRAPMLSWDVRVDRDGEVRLVTGGTLEALSGRAYVYVAASPAGKAALGPDGEKIALGYLIHHERIEHDGEVDEEHFLINLRVSAQLFDRLLDEVRRGVYPHLSLDVSSAPLSLKPAKEELPIKYGWEPDGSGLEWDNKKQDAVEIDGYDFNFQLAADAEAVDHHEERDERAEQLARTTRPVTKADLDELRAQISGRSARILTALWAIAALLVVLVFVR